MEDAFNCEHIKSQGLYMSGSEPVMQMGILYMSGSESVMQIGGFLYEWFRFSGPVIRFTKKKFR